MFILIEFYISLTKLFFTLFIQCIIKILFISKIEFENKIFTFYITLTFPSNLPKIFLFKFFTSAYEKYLNIWRTFTSFLADGCRKGKRATEKIRARRILKQGQYKRGIERPTVHLPFIRFTINELVSLLINCSIWWRF